MNLPYSFTPDCIVFYTNVSLNDRFTQYLEFQNKDLKKRNAVVTFGETDIISYEQDIVPCEPDIMPRKPNIVPYAPDVVPYVPDIVPCERDIAHYKPDASHFETKLALPTNFFENAPLEQWWGSPGESNFSCKLQDTGNVDDSSEPIIYTPIRSLSRVRMPPRNSRRKRKKRKSRLSLTKEELDDELDRYMISVKNL